MKFLFYAIILLPFAGYSQTARIIDDSIAVNEVMQDEEFQTFFIDLGASRNICSNTSFESNWEQAYGLNLNLETQFYFGHVSLGILTERFKKVTAEKSFYSNYSYLGWNYPFHLHRYQRLYLKVGGATGIHLFASDEDREEWEFESEIAWGISGSLHYTFMSSPASFFLKWDHRFIKTVPTISLSNITFGFGYSFDMPRSFRRFLL